MDCVLGCYPFTSISKDGAFAQHSASKIENVRCGACYGNAHFSGRPPRCSISAFLQFSKKISFVLKKFHFSCFYVFPFSHGFCVGYPFFTSKNLKKKKENKGKEKESKTSLNIERVLEFLSLSILTHY